MNFFPGFLNVRKELAELKEHVSSYFERAAGPALVDPDIESRICPDNCPENEAKSLTVANINEVVPTIGKICKISDDMEYGFRMGVAVWSSVESHTV